MPVPVPLPLPDLPSAFLLAFHARHPGLTSATFARGRSYAALAATVAPGAARVLDLGCGDGYLMTLLPPGTPTVGLDLSATELALAARRFPARTLIRGDARALPFAAASFDHVVSHLAFMLVPDATAAAAEVARVLGPGGRFATVVGGGPRGDDAYAGLLALARPHLTAAAAAVPPLGDRRFRSDDGIRAILSPPTWRDVAITDLEVDLSGTVDEVFAVVASAYQLADLPAADRAALQADFRRHAPRWRRPDGRIACTMATRLVTATLR